MSERVKVWLVHQGIWDMEKLSMPLAMGYLKAMAEADSALRAELDIRIFNYGGGHRITHIVPDLLLRETPDILAFSVFGWNYGTSGRIADTFRQLNPAGWCIFGGTHVANQARRVFAMYPGVDIVANGEGERPFVNLLRAYLRDGSRHDLRDIKGISYKTPDGEIFTNPNEERLVDLDEIPSPFLTGAMPLVGANGEFMYDVAMMETNRGCPYKCAYCYWGGAIGQKLSRFSRDRLREELLLFGRLGVENIALCDANFGMLPEDREFLDDLIATRTRYGNPRNMVNSWAKNKSKVFYEIVETMQLTGLTGDFTLALQTLAPAALKTSNRNNMRLNQFDDLCEWLNARGLASYVELIWGLPGETFDSFLDGYDRAACYTPRIATYTNMVLPNSEYDKLRSKYGFVTMRGNDYDFEYILRHNTMSSDDNVRMHGFLFWSRMLSEHLYLRHVWQPLRLLAGISQSRAIRSLERWMDDQRDPVAAGLLACKREVVSNLDTSRIGRGLRYLYREPQVHDLFRRWWEDEILPQVPETGRGFFRALLDYDLLSQPLSADVAAARGCEKVTVSGQAYYVRRTVWVTYEIRSLNQHLSRVRYEDPWAVVERFRVKPGSDVAWYYKRGFDLVIDNHETVLQYVARSLSEIEEEARLRAQGLLAETPQRHVVGLPDRSLST